LEKGLEKGKREVALAMRANGVPNDQICLYTGLTPEEIERL